MNPFSRKIGAGGGVAQHQIFHRIHVSQPKQTLHYGYERSIQELSVHLVLPPVRVGNLCVRRVVVAVHKSQPSMQYFIRIHECFVM